MRLCSPRPLGPPFSLHWTISTVPISCSWRDRADQPRGRPSTPCPQDGSDRFLPSPVSLGSWPRGVPSPAQPSSTPLGGSRSLAICPSSNIRGERWAQGRHRAPCAFLALPLALCPGVRAPLTRLLTVGPPLPSAETSEIDVLGERQT
jgi:hypothetical protein